jgi:branched-chain amino acid transport system substrate-binding protein
MTTGNCGGSRTNILAVVLLVLVTGVAIVLLTRQGAGRKPPTGHKLQVVKIGAILPLSGSLAFMGKMEGDGVKMAVEDINAKGEINDVRLELKFDDSQGKPDVAVTAAQRMLTVDRINIIVASVSGVVLGIKPVVERSGGILIGACMHPDFFKGTANVFRFYIGVEDESKGFVDYLISLKGKTPEPRIGLLYVEAPNVVEQIEKYIEPELSRARMSLAVKESYRQTDKEFRDKILKLRSANITHLLIIGYGFLYPNIFQELKDQKLLGQVQIVGGWGFLYPSVPPEDLEGVVVVGPSYVFERDSTVEQFYSRFRERFGYQANFDAAMTYAAIEVLAKAIIQTENYEPSSIAASLHSLPSIHTLLGDVTISDDGRLSFPVARGIVRKGQLTAITE